MDVFGLQKLGDPCVEPTTFIQNNFERGHWKSERLAGCFWLFIGRTIESMKYVYFIGIESTGPDHMKEGEMRNEERSFLVVEEEGRSLYGTTACCRRDEAEVGVSSWCSFCFISLPLHTCLARAVDL